MKKLKGFLLSFIACATVLALTIPFAACSDDEGGGSTDSNRVLQSISADAFNAKRNFIVGEEYSSEGLVVNAVYAIYTDTGSTTETQNITNDVEIDTSSFDNTRAGTYPIYISYEYNGSEMYASYDVNVISELAGTYAGLELSYSGARQYELTAAANTATIDLSGLTVTSHIGDGLDDITEEMLTAGEYTLAYSVDGGELSAVEGTSITAERGGVYSIYAQSDYTSGNETITMTDFVTVYVLDAYTGIAFKSGTTAYDFNATGIASDWIFTLSFASGNTIDVAYDAQDSAWTMGSTVNNISGNHSVDVSYTWNYTVWDDAIGDASSRTSMQSCSAVYTIGEDPNAGKPVTTTATMTVDEIYAANGGISSAITLADGTELTTEDVPSSGIFVSRSSGMAINGSVVTSEFGTHQNRMQFGSDVSSAALRIVVNGDENSTATITAVFRSSNGSQSRQIGIFTDKSISAVAPGTELQTLDNSDGANNLLTVTFNVTGGGTYYLGASGGVNMYYISFTQTYVSGSGGSETQDASASANDLSVGQIQSNTALTQDGSIMIMATTQVDQNVSVEADDRSFNGMTFTNRIRLNGTGTADYRSIKIEASGAATITVYGMSSDINEARNLALYTVGSNGFSVVQQGSDNDGNAVAQFTFTVTEEGTYYIASTGGSFDLYYIAITY